MSIMVCLTIILLDRLVTYLIRVIHNEYDDEIWVWYRISTDIVGYLIGIIAIVLLMQWHQTYKVLSNPLLALRTFEKNLEKVSIFLFIVSYTIFMIFDISVVLVDWQDPKHHSEFVLTAYKVLVWL